MIDQFLILTVSSTIVMRGLQWAVAIVDEAVRNWSFIVNYSSYIRLWLVNFLLLQPHPLLLLLIVDYALLLIVDDAYEQWHTEKLKQ